MNEKAITVKGCVKDSVTQQPMQNVRVTVLCWYHAGWDKVDFVSIDTITDMTGSFNTFFEEGYKVVVASVARRYFPNLKELDTINSSTLHIELLLRKRLDSTNKSDNPNLKDFIVQNSGN